MIELKYPVILASGSPRRKELLEKLEIPFTIQTVDVEEEIPDEIEPIETAKFLAQLKGDAHDHFAKHHIVISADTVVLVNGKVLGKPENKEEAIIMLKTLSNSSHQVITGVCIRANNASHLFDVSTKVTFGNLSENEIDHYVNSGNANDKAGAYGIQDWIGLIGITRIEGSYYNVMGFPVYEVYEQLKHYYSKRIE